MKAKISILVKNDGCENDVGRASNSRAAYLCLELLFLNIVIQQSLNHQIKLTLENINFSLS
jgi:hypothetical protein